MLEFRNITLIPTHLNTNADGNSCCGQTMLDKALPIFLCMFFFFFWNFSLCTVIIIQPNQLFIVPKWFFSLALQMEFPLNACYAKICAHIHSMMVLACGCGRCFDIKIKVQQQKKKVIRFYSKRFRLKQSLPKSHNDTYMIQLCIGTIFNFNNNISIPLPERQQSNSKRNSNNDDTITKSTKWCWSW